MKRNRQKISDEEQETPYRRGQRYRKPPAKLIEHMTSSPVSSASMVADSSKKCAFSKRADKPKVSRNESTSVDGEMTTRSNKIVGFKNKPNSVAVTQASTRKKIFHDGNCLPPAAIMSAQQNKTVLLKSTSSVPSLKDSKGSDSPLNINLASNSVIEGKISPNESSVSALKCDSLAKSPLVDKEILSSHSCAATNIITTQEYTSCTLTPASDSSLSVVSQEDGNGNEQESMLISLTDTNEGQLDISETYITIETKDGLSSERIPFSQFLKKVVVDKVSGNLKLDLRQLLVSGNLIESNNKSGTERENEKILKMPSSSVPMNVHSQSLTAQQKDAVEKSQEQSTEKSVAKRRGRPPKQKQTVRSPSEALPQNHIATLVPMHSLASETKNSEKCMLSASYEQPAVPSKQKARHDFSHSPRRSRRTPAKNSRFGDDFVDSLTLGKVASSSSTWNTQLMTLALAAERHKNKPQRLGSSKTEEEQELVTDIDTLDESDDESLDEESDMEDNKSDVDYEDGCDEGNKQVLQKKFNILQSLNPKNISDDKGKKGNGNNLRGPKTLKKYEPVDPVVKRSLHEAFNHSFQATAELLSPGMPLIEANDNLNGAFYYTIMEPKIEANGHGLLVEKSKEAMTFKIANFYGNLPNNGDLTKFSKSFPQDRIFSCDLCEKLFPSSNSWLQHNKYIHSRTINSFEGPLSNTAGKGKHSCEFCEQCFPYRFMLDIHIRRKRHSEVKTFRCTLCKESFATHKAREEHWMMSHPARSCGLCGKQFTNIVMLRRHINHNCHGARFRKTAAGVGETYADDNMVVPCDSMGSAERDIIENDESEIDDLNEAKESDAEEADDDDDNDDALYSNQVKSDDGKVKCNICGTEFSTYSGLWYHKLDIHHEFYPQGCRDKLKEKLEKNQNILHTAQDIDPNKTADGNKNKFFVLLKPKWPFHHSKLAITVDEKEFTFKLSDEKMGVQDSLPHNSYADAPSKKETSFACSQCEETFQFASNYREHRSRVHGECFEVLRLLGAFQCTLCSETYPCQFMLDKHLKKHVGKKLLPCTLCGLYFHKIQERRLHWKTVHPGIGCPNCGKMYASIKYLQKHISLNCQDHFPPTKKFLEFQKKQHSDFEMPKNEKKVEKKIIQCHLCPKLCSSVHGWRRHMSESHEDSGFSKLSNTCIICNELVYGYKALEKHLLENHAVESGLPVEEEDGMVEEALKKSDMDITTYRKAGRNNAEIYQDEEGNFHCPNCPKTHPDIRALRTHIRTHVNMNLECSICNKTFKNPTLLKQHVQRHRKDAVYTCDTCSKKFLTLQKLNKHRKVHHNMGNFVCELCGMSFALNDYLQKHKRCHTDKRPHCCTVCGKTFRTKPELRVHVLIHTRETPYKCQYCSRGFSQKGNYRIHLAQHTGEKPYQCDQCEISFALLCHLKRHKVTHDQKINYRCIWCDKECTQRKHMQMHVQRVHKEDFFQYEEQMKLEMPIPIAPSQVKLYNRRLGKMNKVRRQYRTRAQKCDSTIQQLMNGVVAKSEPMDEDLETSQNIVIEPMVEPMIETVSCDMPVTSHENGGIEILVSDDHQNYVKQSITADLLGQDPSNVEIVMGENNEINIIIKDPSALQEVIGTQADLTQLSTGPVQVHESLQQAVEAFVTHARGMREEDVQESLGVSEMEKSTTDILSYDSPSIR